MKYNETPLEERATPEEIHSYYRFSASRAERAALGLAGQWEGCGTAIDVMKDAEASHRLRVGVRWIPCAMGVAPGQPFCKFHGGMTRAQLADRWWVRALRRVPFRIRIARR